MSIFTDLISTVFERSYRRAKGPDRDSRSLTELASALLGSHGEVSGTSLAHTILDRFAVLDEEGKRAFFSFMTHDLDINPDRVRSTLQDYQNSPSKKTWKAFAAASEPARQELARRLNQVPGATGQLVSLRRDLLRLMRDNPDLEPLDEDFRHLFASWFNRGFLVLRPIDWDTPASILEKIIAYEAVHAIDSWDDLRRRLAPADRRCYGFFHPSMPGEPLIFVEVALTRGVPGSIQALLADGRKTIEAEEADTAVFYSISNCQAGLAGISFGNSLIKQVVADLSRDHGNLSTFVTLSPIPGLNRWLSNMEPGFAERWDNRVLAAHYLLEAKRSDGMPYDPVARFHLGNGARVHAVHNNADTSLNGMKQSNGTMVNYLYDLDQISRNHEKFAGSRTVVSSPEVQQLSASIKTSSLGA